VEIKVFTLAFRLVQEESFLNIPSGTPVPLQPRDKWGVTLANGLYYLVVTTKRGVSIGKLMVLR